MRDRRRALRADRAAGSEVIGCPAAYDAEAEAKRLAYSSKLIPLETSAGLLHKGSNAPLPGSRVVGKSYLEIISP
jgi:hypothetical protein